MRLKFWNRWKREKKNIRIEPITSDSYLSIAEFEDDMPKVDNALVMTREHLNKIRGVKADFVIDDDVFVQPKITKGQCVDFKIDGSRCTRIVNTVYCWQHNKNRS